MTTTSVEAARLTLRARWALATFGIGILALFGGGLGYVATRSTETITLALAFFGGMSMLLTP